MIDLYFSVLVIYLVLLFSAVAIDPSSQPSQQPSSPSSQPTPPPTTPYQERVDFASIITLTGSSSGTFHSDEKSAFRSTIVEYMDGIRSTDILIISVYDVSSRKFFRRSLSTASFAIEWNASYNAQQLGFVDAAASIEQYVVLLNNAMADGTFCDTLGTNAAIYSGCNATIEYLNSSSYVFHNEWPTSMPTVTPYPSNEFFTRNNIMIISAVGLVIWLCCAGMCAVVYHHNAHPKATNMRREKTVIVEVGAVNTSYESPLKKSSDGPVTGGDPFFSGSSYSESYQGNSVNNEANFHVAYLYDEIAMMERKIDLNLLTCDDSTVVEEQVAFMKRLRIVYLEYFVMQAKLLQDLDENPNPRPKITGKTETQLQYFRGNSYESTLKWNNSAKTMKMLKKWIVDLLVEQAMLQDLLFALHKVPVIDEGLNDEYTTEGPSFMHCPLLALTAEVVGNIEFGKSLNNLKNIITSDHKFFEYDPHHTSHRSEEEILNIINLFYYEEVESMKIGFFAEQLFLENSTIRETLVLIRGNLAHEMEDVHRSQISGDVPNIYAERHQHLFESGSNIDDKSISSNNISSSVSKSIGSSVSATLEGSRRSGSTTSRSQVPNQNYQYAKANGDDESTNYRPTDADDSMSISDISCGDIPMSSRSQTLPTPSRAYYVPNDAYVPAGKYGFEVPGNLNAASASVASGDNYKQPKRGSLLKQMSLNRSAATASATRDPYKSTQNWSSPTQSPTRSTRSDRP